MIYIFWTCRNAEEAKRIIHGLLNQRLIACASILPEVTSIYRWEGKIETSGEVKVLLKTEKERFAEIQHYILAHSSYEVPEITGIDVVCGNPRYLAWVADETASIPSR